MQIMLLRMKTTGLVFYVTFHYTFDSKTKWRISKEELLPLHRLTRFNIYLCTVGCRVWLIAKERVLDIANLSSSTTTEA